MQTNPPIEVIDLHFQNTPKTIAAHIFETGDGLAMVDCGPQSTIPQLEKALRALNHTLSDVKHLFITHIHLDHSAGAWSLAKHGATVYVHPRGARHLENPEQLIASATSIYGDRMNTLWGEVQAIPKTQIKACADKEEVIIGETVIRAIETPGHAMHHHAYMLGDTLFAGDSAGIAIAESQGVLPPTPPPQLNFSLWKESLAKLRSYHPQKIYLAHFGLSPLAVEDHLTKMENALVALETWVEENLPITEGHHAAALSSLDSLCEKLSQTNIFDTYKTINPTEMSLMGLEHFYQKFLSQASS